MEQEDEHSLQGIKNSKKVTEEQRLSVESHQTEHPSEAKDREDDSRRFNTCSHFPNHVFLFYFVTVQHGSKNHNEDNRIGL